MHQLPVNFSPLGMSEAMKMWGGGQGQGGGWGWGTFGTLAHDLAHTLHLNETRLESILHYADDFFPGAADNSSLALPRTRRVGGVAWAPTAGRGPVLLVNRSLAGVDMAAGGMAVTEREAWGGEVSPVVTWIAFCGVLAVAKGAAPLFQRLGLPLITAYIFSGAVCGPHVLGILAKEAHDHLIYIEMFAMAFITTCAGAELVINDLRPVFTSIVVQLTSISLVTFGSLTVVTYVMVPPRFMGDMADGCQFSVAMLVAAIGIARSPATALAVVKELRCKGKMTTTCLGITMLSDVYTLLAVTLAKQYTYTACNGTLFDSSRLGFLVLMILVSVALGLVVGAGYMALISARQAANECLPLSLILPASIHAGLLR